MREEILQLINSQKNTLKKLSRFTGVNESLNIKKNIISPSPSFFSSNSEMFNALNNSGKLARHTNEYFGGNIIKPKLVLDLDETLVNAYIREVNDPVPPPEVDERTITFDIDQGTIYFKVRPHVPTFLERVSRIYDLWVFSNGIEQYVRGVVLRIDPDRRYFKPHRVT